MRSADRHLAVPLAVGVSLALAGCVSTQTKNARLVLENERTVDSQASVNVTRINRSVAVTRIALVRARDGMALAVSLRNLASRPVSDLPISVGVAPRRGPRRYLNRAADLAYFDTHVPGLGAGAALTWVLPLRRLTLPPGRLFATIGFAGIPPSTPQTELPGIAATQSSPTGGALAVTVANRSGVPQQQLPVYAVASRTGRTVAAGRTTIPALAGGARITVRLHLLGTSTGASIELFAPPTIFH